MQNSEIRIIFYRSKIWNENTQKKKKSRPLFRLKSSLIAS